MDENPANAKICKAGRRPAPHQDNQAGNAEAYARI